MNTQYMWKRVMYTPCCNTCNTRVKHILSLAMEQRTQARSGWGALQTTQWRRSRPDAGPGLQTPDSRFFPHMASRGRWGGPWSPSRKPLAVASPAAELSAETGNAGGPEGTRAGREGSPLSAPGSWCGGLCRPSLCVCGFKPGLDAAP